MSKTFTLTFLLTAAILATGTYFAKTMLLSAEPAHSPNSHRHNHKHDRTPSSKKTPFLKSDGPQRTMKLQGNIWSSMHVSDRSTTEDTVVLIGRIGVDRTLRNVHVRWQLPDGVTVIAGSTDFSVPEIQPKYGYEFSLEVAFKSLDETRVHFLASTTLGSTRMSHGSQGVIKSLISEN